jgi:capsular polysaccharide biosynthesis protein
MMILKKMLLKTLSLDTKIISLAPSDYNSIGQSFLFPFSGAIVDGSSALYRPSAFFDKKIHKIIQQSTYIYTRNVDTATVIGHGGWNNYYHWYIDCLPRIFNLRSFPNSIGAIDLFISQKLSKVERDLLKTLVPDNVRIIYTHRYLRVKAERSVFLPFLSADRSAALPPDYLNFYRTKVFNFLQMDQQRNRVKIYVSRALASKRRFVNHQAVERYFESKGFVSVCLEKLKFQEQVKLFYNAETVVGVHGAGLTNLLYCSDCSVLEIFHSASGDLTHYRSLAGAMGLPYQAFYLNGVDKDADVLISEQELDNCLKLLNS